MTNKTVIDAEEALELFRSYVEVSTDYVDIDDEAWERIKPDPGDFMYVRDIVAELRLLPEEKFPTMLWDSASHAEPPYDLNALKIPADGVAARMTGTLYELQYRPIVFDPEREEMTPEFVNFVREEIGLVDRLLLIKSSTVIDSMMNSSVWYASSLLRPILDLFPNSTVLVIHNDDSLTSFVTGDFTDKESISYRHPSAEHSGLIYDDVP